jgi:hypothetical protein
MQKICISIKNVLSEIGERKTMLSVQHEKKDEYTKKQGQKCDVKEQ